jgi:hypothetical protein
MVFTAVRACFGVPEVVFTAVRSCIGVRKMVFTTVRTCFGVPEGGSPFTVHASFRPERTPRLCASVGRCLHALATLAWST